MSAGADGPAGSDGDRDGGGEDGFIAALRAIATTPGARGLADDAAELALDGATLVLTHDMMVEGIHWLPGQDLADMAWKLVAVNLSDLAAKGARPLGLLLGYTLGDADADARFAAGLAEAVCAFGVPLLGGDTVSAPAGSARSIGLTAIGAATRTPSPARADAAPGHTLWVTGPLGAALAGFEAMQAGDNGTASLPYRRPQPLLAEGEALAPHVGAMMDVSDGLLLDAWRMAEASGTTIAIDCAMVPIHSALTGREYEAMTWGDDYQLLFTLPADTPCPIAAHRIGMVLARGTHPLLLDGVPPPAHRKLGYRHAAS
ncbi:MAG TPA: thiamine-phosphate kinase [Croceicoccus sp.]|nr:thiamine-phosphate kinase [Croceicoccus sp.]